MYPLCAILENGEQHTVVPTLDHSSAESFQELGHSRQPECIGSLEATRTDMDFDKEVEEARGRNPSP
ncbi:hypothetical protein T265_09031 [Opisthorchis viverrini]|uniref:Uncharacterized protein n=1 Tax=Opisthorchis viverrini TaxID=6198 RepID=A0A075A6B4_OPIVI|nr:hypothetical protein T265_09031 [Opisthorchis viverrini]KER22989.1 hypothetical protein T265_09031 [Opisthorchis viverrini]